LKISSAVNMIKMPA